MRTTGLLIFLLAAGAGSVSQLPAAAPPPRPPSFEEDVAFLDQHGPIVLLAGPRRSKVAVSPRYQGRVMTSAVEPSAPSLGFVNRAFIAAGRTGTPFDNYGGEDRFWLGPEGGPYALFFAPGAPLQLEHWQTPAALQQGAWAVTSRSSEHVVFTRDLTVANAAGTAFEVAVERRVQVLSDPMVEDHLDLDLGRARDTGVTWVAFESVNRITNRGSEPWTKATGLPSIWILGMFPPSPDATVVVPFETAGTGPIVDDSYFGAVPASRLLVREKEGHILFKGDGRHRGKIGVGPGRARNVLGSYTPSWRLLTIVQFDMPAGREYVNSLWTLQGEPYRGDVVNSYNDGPVPGAPAQPPFYELETSSPAADLAPGQSLVHVHRTFHFVGGPRTLDTLATRVLGVSATRVARGLP